MALTEEDALLVREGDTVLVPVRVVRTNNHYDSQGVLFNVLSPQILYGRDEYAKGPPVISIKSSQVHSIVEMPVAVRDHVEWNASGPGACPEPETGVVVHIDGDDITVKQDKERTPRNRVILRQALTRRLSPKKEA